MTTLEVGKKLVELCQQGKNEEAIRTLYADDVVSVEASGPPGGDPVSRGKDAVIAKGAWWADNHIVHSAASDGPYPHGDRFAVRFTYDVTFKPSGQRFTMNEVALYTVQDDKIVRDEFFYSM